MSKHKTNFYHYSTKKCPNGWRCILNFTMPGGGYAQASGTGLTQSDAYEAASKRKARKLSQESKVKDITFKEVCSDWYDNVYSTNRDGKEKKPSTLYQVKGFKKNYLIPDLGSFNIKDITTNQLEDLVFEWKKRNNNFRAIFGYVNKVFQYARRKGYIKINPCTDVDLPAKRKPKNVNLRKYFTIDETNSILKYFKDKHDFRKYLYVWLIAMTGARRGEIIALTWSKVDFKDKSILISRISSTNDDGKQYIGDTTKVASTGSRRVYFDDLTMKYLRRWKHDQEAYYSGASECPYVIDNGYGRYVGNNVPDNWLKEARKALELPSNLTLHSFRRAWATDTINNGLTVKQAQGQLGHSNPNTTLAIYTSLTEEKRRETSKEFNKILTDNGFEAPWKL